MIDWDQVNTDAMTPFLQGDAADPTTLPLYTPAGSAAFTLATSVFDRAFTEVSINPDTGVGVSTVKPVLGVLLSQFARPPAQGDKVWVPSIGLNYVVSNVEPDGHGWALLKLNRTAP